MLVEASLDLLGTLLQPNQPAVAIEVSSKACLAASSGASMRLKVHDRALQRVVLQCMHSSAAVAADMTSK
jgi:hypothetical protein